MSSTSTPLVGIVMGSSSDLPTVRPATEILEKFGIGYEIRVLSAHRSPEATTTYARTAHERGMRVLIGAAGGAAHLPGVIAAHTPLPVIGLPVAVAGGLAGVDSLLSIVQMPKGVPVATVSIGGAANAGILAVQILATADDGLRSALRAYKDEIERGVMAQDEQVQRANA
jgi:5-(carboxyamino)imidazole ribonucleotide mutase